MHGYPTASSRGLLPSVFVSAGLTLYTEQSLSCQPKLAQKCMESVQSKLPPFSKVCFPVYCSIVSYERCIHMFKINLIKIRKGRKKHVSFEIAGIIYTGYTSL